MSLTGMSSFLSRQMSVSIGGPDEDFTGSEIEYSSTEGEFVGTAVCIEQVAFARFSHVYKVYFTSGPMEGELGAAKILTTGYSHTHDKARVLLEQLYQREVRALSMLNHPNVISLLGLGEVEVLGSRRRVIMLEWMHGGDARTLLDQAMRPMDPQAADSLILPLALALEAAHKAGFVHRDVKVRLADWGISVPVEEAASRMSTGGTRERMPGSVGTEFWCAPEIERGLPHGFASDVFSLAITYIELVTGSDPKYDNSIQGVRTLALPSTGFIPDYLPEDTQQWLASCLAADPVLRPSIPDLLSFPAFQRIAARMAASKAAELEASEAEGEEGVGEEGGVQGGAGGGWGSDSDLPLLAGSCQPSLPVPSVPVSPLASLAPPHPPLTDAPGPPPSLLPPQTATSAVPGRGPGLATAAALPGAVPAGSQDNSSTTSASHCPDIPPAGTGAGLTSAGGMVGAAVVKAGSLAAGAAATDQRPQGCHDQPLLSVFAAVQQPGQVLAAAPWVVGGHGHGTPHQASPDQGGKGQGGKGHTVTSHPRRLSRDKQSQELGKNPNPCGSSGQADGQGEWVGGGGLRPGQGQGQGSPPTAPLALSPSQLHASLPSLPSEGLVPGGPRRHGSLAGAEQQDPPHPITVGLGRGVGSDAGLGSVSSSAAAAAARGDGQLPVQLSGARVVEGAKAGPADGGSRAGLGPVVVAQGWVGGHGVGEGGRGGRWEGQPPIPSHEAHTVKPLAGHCKGTQQPLAHGREEEGEEEEGVADPLQGQKRQQCMSPTQPPGSCLSGSCSLSQSQSQSQGPPLCFEDRCYVDAPGLDPAATQLPACSPAPVKPGQGLVLAEPAGRASTQQQQPQQPFWHKQQQQLQHAKEKHERHTRTQEQQQQQKAEVQAGAVESGQHVGMQVKSGELGGSYPASHSAPYLDDTCEAPRGGRQGCSGCQCIIS
ncbi:kinase-like domain-containing protein [Haematococcus lacustris]